MIYLRAEAIATIQLSLRRSVHRSYFYWAFLNPDYRQARDIFPFGLAQDTLGHNGLTKSLCATLCPCVSVVPVTANKYRI